MKKSIFYIFLLSFTLLTISCEDNPTCNDGIQNGDETGIDCGGECPACETTVSEDQANIQETFDDLLMCVTEFKDSKSIDILFRDFLKLSNGDVQNDIWLSDFSDNLEYVIDFDHIEDKGRLDLNYHSGTHIFNSANQTWSKVNDVNDRMVFLFPSEPSMTTNNVELIMDKYKDKQVTIDGEDVFLPTAAHILMNVDGQRMAELNLDNITYAENDNYEIPVEASATLFMDPLNMTFELNRQSTTAYRLESTLENSGSCAIGLEVDVVLKDDDFENLSAEGFEKVNVKINVGRMTIQSIADIALLISKMGMDISDTEINSLMDIDALIDGVKIADIEINEEQETILIFYKDLSSEDSSVYYKSFWESIKNLWTEFFD